MWPSPCVFRRNVGAEKGKQEPEQWSRYVRHSSKRRRWLKGAQDLGNNCEEAEAAFAAVMDGIYAFDGLI